MKAFIIILCLLANPVLAAETAQPAQDNGQEGAAPPAPPTVTTQTVKVEGIGEVTAAVTNIPNPEPVDLPVSILVTLKCIGSTLDRKLHIQPLRGCDFDSIGYDKATRQVVVKYKLNVLDDDSGVLVCKGPRTFQRRLDCNIP